MPELPEPWFLSTRSSNVGGSVSPVRVMRQGMTYIACPQALVADVRGRDILLGTHGFNVHQAAGTNALTCWSTMLSLGPSGIFAGVLWPGDSAWIGALEYAFAAATAMHSGIALATFANDHLTGCASLSFVSHSLGARVALETIRRLAPSFTVRRLIMMAPAVDDDCLTDEFADVAERVERIFILASHEDEVLKLAFPLGNPISGIFAEGHPFWHCALGREGPTAYPTPNNISTPSLLPNAWQVGHGDYLPPPSPYPPGYQPLPYITPITMPMPSVPSPAPDTPSGYEFGQDWKYWQASWTAALTSARFK